MSSNSNGGRWKNKKDKDRMIARNIIYEHCIINNRNNNGDYDEKQKDKAEYIANDTMIKTYINAIESRMICHFGLSRMVKDFYPSSSDTTTNNKIDKTTINQLHSISLLNLQKALFMCTSRFGKEFANKAKHYFHYLQNYHDDEGRKGQERGITLLEYATIIGEYQIASSLLHAGADPTKAGSTVTHNATTIKNSGTNKVMFHKMFFGNNSLDTFPSMFAVWIVRCVIVMRINGIYYNYSDDCNNNNNDSNNCCNDIQIIEAGREQQGQQQQQQQAEEQHSSANNNNNNSFFSSTIVGMEEKDTYDGEKDNWSIEKTNGDSSSSIHSSSESTNNNNDNLNFEKLSLSVFDNEIEKKTGKLTIKITANQSGNTDSTYINDNNNNDNEHNSTNLDLRRQKYYCSVCTKHFLPCQPLLNYGTPCYHTFCENCVWYDIICNVYERNEILCPICLIPKQQEQRYDRHVPSYYQQLLELQQQQQKQSQKGTTSSNDDEKQNRSKMLSSSNSRRLLGEESLKKFQALLMSDDDDDSNEGKDTDDQESDNHKNNSCNMINNNTDTSEPASQSNKKNGKKKQKIKKCNRMKNINKKNTIDTSWSMAVVRYIGRTQDKRVEAFFEYVVKNSFHHVKGCLDNGIDINTQNEYKQSALYIACWYGYENIVQLLLSYGANPKISTSSCDEGKQNVPNDKKQKQLTSSTPLSVARHHGHHHIVKLLLESIQFGDYIPSLSIENDQDDNDSRSDYVKNPSKNIKNDKRIQFDNVKQDIATSHTIPKDGVANSMLLQPKLTVLIDNEKHPGAGSFIIDNAVPEDVLQEMECVWKELPVEYGRKGIEYRTVCSQRSYFCDAENRFCSQIAKHIPLKKLSVTPSSLSSLSDVHVQVMPHMRFLNYEHIGISLAPHVDLSRTDPLTGRKTTHTFLLYLYDCKDGGETNLLREIPMVNNHNSKEKKKKKCASCAYNQNDEIISHNRCNILASVKPKRGRLLVFPHLCPHEGVEVISLPKVLLRGEVCTFKEK